MRRNSPGGCIARVIRFLDDENWYAALGTDWSMGTGGATYVYWTLDAGETWTCRLLPDTDALLLTGLEYTDTMNGMLTMEGSFWRRYMASCLYHGGWRREFQGDRIPVGYYRK